MWFPETSFFKKFYCCIIIVRLNITLNVSIFKKSPELDVAGLLPPSPVAYGDFSQETGILLVMTLRLLATVDGTTVVVPFEGVLWLVVTGNTLNITISTD